MNFPVLRLRLEKTTHWRKCALCSVCSHTGERSVLWLCLTQRQLCILYCSKCVLILCLSQRQLCIFYCCALTSGYSDTIVYFVLWWEILPLGPFENICLKMLKSTHSHTQVAIGTHRNYNIQHITYIYSRGFFKNPTLIKKPISILSMTSGTYLY